MREKEGGWGKVWEAGREKDRGDRRENGKGGREKKREGERHAETGTKSNMKGKRKLEGKKEKVRKSYINRDTLTDRQGQPETAGGSV